MHAPPRSPPIFALICTWAEIMSCDTSDTDMLVLLNYQYEGGDRRAPVKSPQSPASSMAGGLYPHCGALLGTVWVVQGSTPVRRFRSELLVRRVSLLQHGSQTMAGAGRPVVSGALHLGFGIRASS